MIYNDESNITIIDSTNDSVLYSGPFWCSGSPIQTAGKKNATITFECKFNTGTPRMQSLFGDVESVGVYNCNGEHLTNIPIDDVYDILFQ